MATCRSSATSAARPPPTPVVGRSRVNTTADGHFYAQNRIGESYAVELYSQWTPDFKTEVKYSVTTKDDQLTPINTVAPMTYVFGVSAAPTCSTTPPITERRLHRRAPSSSATAT